MDSIPSGIFSGGNGDGARNKVWGSLVFWESQGIFEKEVQRVTNWLEDKGYDDALKIFEEEVKTFREVRIQ